MTQPIPEGNSTRLLIQMAKDTGCVIFAGRFEKDDEQRIYSAYLCVDGNGLIARFRKLHPFVSPHLSKRKEYVVFDICGWKCGISIRYDNNVIENVRDTAHLGAEIIVMPHVTLCTPSTRPRAGFVEPKPWENRFCDPTTLRQEFNGLKGCAWLIKWLPARPYDNALYVVFANPVGMADDHLNNGCLTIIDPLSDIAAECTELWKDIAIALCTKWKLFDAEWCRYRMARRPELYRDIISRELVAKHKVAWI